MVNVYAGSYMALSAARAAFGLDGLYSRQAQDLIEVPICYSEGVRNDPNRFFMRSRISTKFSTSLRIIFFFFQQWTPMRSFHSCSGLGRSKNACSLREYSILGIKNSIGSVKHSFPANAIIGPSLTKLRHCSKR